MADVFSLYFRVDMGLSFKWLLFKQYEAIIQFEVLNVFNHTNVAAYSWFETEPQQVERIPQVFTPRFFNIGFDLRI